MPENIRTFVAVPIPASVREAVARVQANLKASLNDVSWIRPNAMHLTLHFFGNVATARLAEINAALAAAVAGHAPLQLRVRGVGQFSQRVIWAGLEGDVAPLKKLALAIRSAVARLGFEVERREFNPHVTLGRVRIPARGMVSKLAPLRDVEFGTFTANHVELIRSELSPHGSRYTVLTEFPLREM